MHALERKYWWFQGRRLTILGVLEEALSAHPPAGGGEGGLKLLDAGCGTGMLLDDLARFGMATGIDFSPLALQYSRQRGLTRLGRADAQRMPLSDNCVDIVASLDVVEHVPDDVKVMSEFFRVVRPGGLAVMTVPAHPSLWSSHDVALHHYRRYTRAGFESLVRGAGFELLRLTPTVATAYLPAAVFRRAKRWVGRNEGEPRTDEFPLPSWLNAGLLAMMRAEARWLRHHDLPFGLSLLCIARKPMVP